MMKKLLLSGVASVAIMAAVPASAADLSMRPAYKAAPIVAPVPVFSWTGCHVGAHVGWGWGRHNIRERTVESFSGGHDVNAVSGTLDSSGAIFGGQVGCDYQFAAQWVLGVEASFSGADINGVGSDPFVAVDSDATVNNLQVKTDWLTSVTGRFGFAGLFPQTLWYVRGGVAWAHERWDLTHMAFEAFNGSDNNPLIQQTRTGWTIGAGVEWAFAPSWSAFVEWDHYDFGSKTLLDHADSPGQSQFTHGILDTTSRIETVRIGVNYRFGGLFGVGKGVSARY
jgi:outer membrane immunogenic protein